MLISIETSREFLDIVQKFSKKWDEMDGTEFLQRIGYVGNWKE